MEHPFYGSWGYQTTGYFAPDQPLRHAAGLHVPHRPPAPARHRRDPRLGARRTSRATSTAWATSTARTCTSTPTRARASTPTGRARSSTTAATRCAASCLAARCSGSTSTTSTACASTRSPRCSTSTTRARQGEWIPNRYGGRENLEAIEFLRRLNESVYRDFPDVQTIAEESTAWPLVSRPIYLGGLGFGLKWDMGWMHDTLDYLKHDPVHRKYHHNELTFRMLYAFTENFVLPLSHDEVVHGKGSLLGRMPGDDGSSSPTCACCSATCGRSRARSCCSWAASSASGASGTTTTSLDWHLLERACRHQGVQRWVRDLNRFYRERAGAARARLATGGLRVGRRRDAEQSVLAFLRKAAQDGDVARACSTSRRCRATTTASACRAAAAGARLLNSDAAALRRQRPGQLRRRARPKPCPATATATPSLSPCLPLERSSSSLHSSAAQRESLPVRVVIEGVRPEVDCGRYPVKRVTGEEVVVEADVFADGHDVVVAELLHKNTKEKDWHAVPMEFLGNDRWRASFRVGKVGRYEYTVRGWADPLLTWQRDLEKRKARRPGRRHRPADRRRDREACRAHTSASTTRCCEVVVDPPRARFSSWYEMFPRSASGDGAHGTFRDVIERAAVRRRSWASTCSTCRRSIPSAPPRARGRTTTWRRRRATSAVPGPSAPSAAGTRRCTPSWARWTTSPPLVREAKKNGIEIALDIAFQCSPDHPYVQAAPGVVPLAARRHGAVRREPAEEIPGHLPVRVRDRGMAGALWTS